MKIPVGPRFLQGSFFLVRACVPAMLYICFFFFTFFFRSFPFDGSERVFLCVWMMMEAGDLEEDRGGTAASTVLSVVSDAREPLVRIHD